MAPKRGKKVQKSEENDVVAEVLDDPLSLDDEETSPAGKKTAKAARAGKTAQKGKNNAYDTEEPKRSGRGAKPAEKLEAADEEDSENETGDGFSPKSSPGKKTLPPKEETKKKGRGAKKRAGGGEGDGVDQSKIARRSEENDENKSSGTGKKRGRKLGWKKIAGKAPASRKSPRTNI